MNNTTELIEHQKISAIVDNVNLAIKESAEALDLLASAKNRLKSTLGGYKDTIFEGYSGIDYSIGGTDLKEKVKDTISKNAWRYLLDVSGITKITSQKRKEELEKQIDSGQLPDITEENIFAFFQDLPKKTNELLDEFIKETFDWLLPGRWDTYKTNKRSQIGRKAILSYVVESNYSGGYRLSYSKNGHIRSLGNVFSLLDGKGVGKYPDDLETKLNNTMAPKRDDRIYEDGYFRIKWFKNQNIHIEFKRLDLLKKLNQYGGNGDKIGSENRI